MYVCMCLSVCVWVFVYVCDLLLRGSERERVPFSVIE